MNVEEFLTEVMKGQEDQLNLIKGIMQAVSKSLARIEALEQQIKRLEEAHLKMD